MLEKLKQLDKRLLLGIGVFLVLIIILIVTFLVKASKDTPKEKNTTPNNTSKISTENHSLEEQTTTPENHSEEAPSTSEQSSEQQTSTPSSEQPDNEDPQAEKDQNLGDGASVNLNQMEQTVSAIGIDVSRYQGKIDWKKVAQSGIDFAMIRVGYRTTVSGTITEDPYAKYNLANAAANGISVGAYFFSSAVNETEAIEEANWTANFVSGYGITYPVAYNCENYKDSSNRQYSLSKAERSTLACVFLDTITQKGYQSMFYASKQEMEQDAEWNISEISGHGKVWTAWYPSVPYPETQKAAYNGVHHMWQYTNKGSVDGITGNVDINVSYLDISSEKPSVNPQNTQEITISPEANMNFKEVNDTVTAKIEVNLRNKPSQDTDSTIVASLKNGTTATRTGISDSGWSRIIYNGQTCYAVSSYLTTDLTPATQATQAPSSNPEVQTSETATTMRNQFTEVSETVTPKEEVNLRSLPSVTDSEVVATVKNGEILTKTGVSDLGWARVIYNGQTLYCINSYLTNME